MMDMIVWCAWLAALYSCGQLRIEFMETCQGPAWVLDGWWIEL